MACVSVRVHLLDLGQHGNAVTQRRQRLEGLDFARVRLVAHCSAQHMPVMSNRGDQGRWNASDDCRGQSIPATELTWKAVEASIVVITGTEAGADACPHTTKTAKSHTDG